MKPPPEEGWWLWWLDDEALLGVFRRVFSTCHYKGADFFDKKTPGLFGFLHEAAHDARHGLPNAVLHHLPKLPRQLALLDVELLDAPGRVPDPLHHRPHTLRHALHLHQAHACGVRILWRCLVKEAVARATSGKELR